VAESGVMEIDGRKMKLCPGWEGNSYRCGRGNPRLIRAEADVCENCSRGMRKAGQRSREEEEAKRRAMQKRVEEAQRGAAAIRERASLPAGPIRYLREILEERGKLTRSDLEGREVTNYYGNRIYGPALEDVLLVLAGLPIGDEE